jgi:hypothetical protein
MPWALSLPAQATTPLAPSAQVNDAPTATSTTSVSAGSTEAAPKVFCPQQAMPPLGR